MRLQQAETDIADKALLRSIRDKINEVAALCKEANGKGYSINFNFDLPNGVAHVQFARMVPVAIEEG